MNNRQKAKHFKRKYEELLEKPLKIKRVVIDNYDLIPLQAKRMYRINEIAHIPGEVVKNELFNMMIPDLLSNTEIITYPHPETMEFEVKARIYIARRK